MKYEEDYSEYPSVEELWAKLNDHENYGQRTVKASEFFCSPKQLLEAMQQIFTKGEVR